MIIHELKTWPEFYEHILSGEKTFELRRDDRAFRVGDVLVLREWRMDTQEYTGREIRRSVTYLTGGMGLKPDFVCMGLSEWQTMKHDTLRERFNRVVGKYFPTISDVLRSRIVLDLVEAVWKWKSDNEEMESDPRDHRRSMWPTDHELSGKIDPTDCPSAPLGKHECQWSWPITDQSQVQHMAHGGCTCKHCGNKMDEGVRHDDGLHVLPEKEAMPYEKAVDLGSRLASVANETLGADTDRDVGVRQDAEAAEAGRGDGDTIGVSSGTPAINALADLEWAAILYERYKTKSRREALEAIRRKAREIFKPSVVFRPAQVFPPGEYLRHEISSRGWTRAEFAGRVGCDEVEINDVMERCQPVGDLAEMISKVLRTSIDVWQNMDALYLKALADIQVDLDVQLKHSQGHYARPRAAPQLTDKIHDYLKPKGYAALREAIRCLPDDLIVASVEQGDARYGADSMNINFSEHKNHHRTIKPVGECSYCDEARPKRVSLDQGDKDA